MFEEPLSPDDILYEACHISCPDERRRYLDKVCGDDHVLRARIEKQAAIAARVDSIVPDAALAARRWANDGDEPSRSREDLTGTVLGDYRLVQHLGDGGFASVYEAERLSGDGVHVAIKILKLGMDSHEVLARFRREQALLDRLDHPHIARQYNYGMSQQGRPYMVMEMVPGQSITSFCDDRQLPIRDRIELFLSVCDAIQHAHALSIIHRDVKPNNILVTVIDSRPVAKVIDFGIAKAMGAGEGTSTLYSRPSQVIGTPQYMSPEQAEQSSNVGESSDQYSLAAVLYELVTGVSHLGLSAAQCRQPGSCLEQLRGGEAVWPSTHLSTLTDETLDEVAFKRGTDAVALRAAIDRDLESILFHALQRDPHRRYSSVAEFADNLRAYLAGGRVVGTSPTFFYTVCKLTRDYQRQMLGTALFMVMLMATSLFSIWMALSARDAQARAIASEKKTQAALQAAHQAHENERKQREQALEASQCELAALAKSHVNGEIARVFRAEFLGAITVPGKGPATTVNELLDNIIQNFIPRYTEYPLVQASLLEAVAAGKMPQYRYADAIDLYRRAFELRKAHQGANHGETLQAELLLCNAYCNAEQYADAKPLVSHLLSLPRRGLSEDNRRWAEYYSITILFSECQYDEALRSSDSFLQQILNDSSAAEFQRMVRRARGAILLKLGRLDEAEVCLQELVQSDVQKLGANHAESQRSQYILNDVQILRGDNEKALVYCQDLFTRQTKSLGEEHHDTLVTGLRMAGLYYGIGRYADSESLCLLLLARQRNVLSEQSPITLKTKALMARNYEATGRDDAALSLYRATLTEMESALGDEHDHTQTTAFRFAKFLYRLGKPAEAEPLLRRGVALSAKAEGVEHRHTLERASLLASVLRDCSQFDEAAELFTRTLESQLRTLGERHEDTLTTLYEFGKLRVVQQRASDAVLLLEKALEGRRTVLGPDHEDPQEVERLLRSLVLQPTPENVATAPLLP